MVVEKPSDETGRQVTHTREVGPPLLDRLDDALGEASSGIGVLLSELVRRTLRGGVQKIDEEMAIFVHEKLEDAVAARMPEFEDVATRTAAEKAQLIAEAAVLVVDQQAKQSAEELSQKIEAANETVSTLDNQTKEKAEQLTQHISTVEEQAKAASSQLTEQLSSVENQANAAVTNISETSTRLEQQLAEARAEAKETTERMLADLQAKSKGTASKIEGNLRQLHQQSKQLIDELAAERERRAQSEATSQDLLDRMTARVTMLEAEIEELKRPRGLAALGAKLFGGKKKKKPALPAAPESEPPADDAS